MELPWNQFKLALSVLEKETLNYKVPWVGEVVQAPRNKEKQNK